MLWLRVKIIQIADKIKQLAAKEMENVPFSKRRRAQMCWGFAFSKLTDKQIMEKLGLTSSEWNAMLYGSKDVSESYYEKAISLMEGNHV